MLLPHVQEAIDKAPRYIAGVSFSDRTIRYIEVERENGVLTLSSFGQQTVPYDTIEGGKVIDPISFTDTVKKLATYIHKDARIVIKDDGDSTKAETLALAGFGEILFKKGSDALRGVFVPWGIDTKRICFFANYDTTHIFVISESEVKKLGSYSEQELLDESSLVDLKHELEQCENKEILIAGKYKDSSFTERLVGEGFRVAETSIWQNLFDFSRYIPEIPQDQAYIYTLPAGLVVSGLMEELRRYHGKKSAQQPAGPTQTDAFDFTEPHNDLSEAFADLQPLTKMHDDHKTPPEEAK